MFLLGGVERGLALARLRQRLLKLSAPGQRDGLIGLPAVQVGGGGDIVVGEQAQPGVPQVRLDGGGAPGERRLPAERPQAAAQLAGEIDQPGQVGLHRLQLAERLLLAPAVLEYPRRLLDQRAARLGPGLQHVVQVALAHDDVHLPAQAGVGEQLGDVEQAALVAVDEVLALARAEQQPADRDLGVVDRQRAVGVVDGERDLGPPQRRPRGGAGEDDVLHLAAAQGLDPLLTHDPGQGVDDVRLARPVRADDAGDARLEPQGRGRGEGLEPAQGESLQVHLLALLLVGPVPVRHAVAGARCGPILTTLPRSGRLPVPHAPPGRNELAAPPATLAPPQATQRDAARRRPCPM